MSNKFVPPPNRKEIADERLKKETQDFMAVAKESYVKFFERLPSRYKRNWLACFNGKASRRKAIAAKCYECAGYEDTIANVGECTVRLCPLWKYRPLQKKTSSQ
jgi:hypothetical protein